jgi:hypothetical protein
LALGEVVFANLLVAECWMPSVTLGKDVAVFVSVFAVYYGYSAEKCFGVVPALTSRRPTVIEIQTF